MLNPKDFDQLIQDENGEVNVDPEAELDEEMLAELSDGREEGEEDEDQ